MKVNLCRYTVTFRYDYDKSKDYLNTKPFKDKVVLNHFSNNEKPIECDFYPHIENLIRNSKDDDGVIDVIPLNLPKQTIYTILYDKCVRWEISEDTFVLFDNGVGFYYFDVKNMECFRRMPNGTTNLHSQLTIAELTHDLFLYFNNRVIELAYDNYSKEYKDKNVDWNVSPLLSETCRGHFTSNGEDFYIYKRVENEFKQLKGVEFFSNRDLLDMKNIPDRAHPFLFILDDIDEESYSYVGRAAKGYDNNYTFFEPELDKLIFQPFKDRMWALSLEGIADIASLNNQFYTTIFSETRIFMYYYLYILSLHQYYSLLYLTTDLSLSIIKNKKMKSNEIARYLDDISLFQTKYYYPEVSYISHHNDYYQMMLQTLKVDILQTELKEEIVILEEYRNRLFADRTSVFRVIFTVMGGAVTITELLQFFDVNFTDVFSFFTRFSSLFMNVFK